MKNRVKISIIILFLILVLLVISLVIIKLNENKYNVYNNEVEYTVVFDKKAEIEEYYIYGTHYNFKGSIKIDELSISNNLKFEIVMKNEIEEELIDFKYDIKQDKLSFNTSEIINEGMNLEEIKSSEYKVYLKTTDEEQRKITYYIMENKTNDGDLEYYTITKNESNNYIKIYWNEEGLNILCKECKLPENVYDIVLDQGHGTSTGAKANGYIEADINYDVGIKLKEELEKLGLKVLVTRDYKNKKVPDYGEDGRAVIPHKVKAKYCFSLHNNYSDKKERDGVEIYAPKFANLEFAKDLADNIVEIAGSTYSQNTVGKVLDGVYVLTFTQDDVDSTIEDSKRLGYEPYKVSTDTMYFYMIREVGGRLTGGYVDGRDERIDINPYWNSNNVAEAYLLELAYVSNKDDIENMVYNMDSYIYAIVKSIKKELNI